LLARLRLKTSEVWVVRMIRNFDELAAEERTLAGGKGGTLAWLYQAGYPVPDGFVILPTAFEGDELDPEAWAQVQAHLARMRQDDKHAAFAVRSSALSEDSAQASFAGEFETVLDVRIDEDIREAIRTVRRSRHSARVRAYSQAHGMDAAHEMAVVVQRLIPAEVSGVLFTADPVTGSRAFMTGNFVYGMGDQLVSGEANPQAFTLQWPKGRYGGPPELKRAARQLYKLASRLEEELGGAQDIEWAIARGELFVLQSRPITTLRAYDPTTGEWNDSLRGDYLWTNANFGEAFPDVMTPFTWSIVQAFMGTVGFGIETGQHPMMGNIAGRLYMNISLSISALATLGLRPERFIRTAEETFGRIPPGVEIPRVPLARWWVLRSFITAGLRRRWSDRKLKRRVPAFIAETPALVKKLQAEIQAAQTPADLLALWHEKLQVHLDEGYRLLMAGLSEYRTLSRQLHVEFENLLGDSDANALLSGVSTGGDPIASIGMLMDLIKVSRGEMSRADYLQQYGHRGPHEMELSTPRPAEDPAWFDRRMAEVESRQIDVPAMLAAQHRRHEAAWGRLKAKVPRKAKSYRQKLERMAAASKMREASRSEAVRALGVMRTFALRAGELTGLGNDVFFLSLEEVVAALSGDRSAVDFIPARRETHARYSALPPYPTLIRGRFDPFQWAADPNRPSDYYNARAPITAPASESITGFAGAAGIVEGPVRRLDSPEEGGQLQPGEILVTTTTNIGWTPLFPRAAAIVTDVGAPLSHAAIVARELGIPAVVGCGNATMRLRTGDRVLVNGGQGVVEILSIEKG
jgi:phosphohistidine swiveling domain-containing protein